MVFLLILSVLDVISLNFAAKLNKINDKKVCVKCFIVFYLHCKQQISSLQTTDIVILNSMYIHIRQWARHTARESSLVSS